jgi:hypothetical protein
VKPLRGRLGSALELSPQTGECTVQSHLHGVRTLSEYVADLPSREIGAVAKCDQLSLSRRKRCDCASQREVTDRLLELLRCSDVRRLVVHGQFAQPPPAREHRDAVIAGSQGLRGVRPGNVRSCPIAMTGAAVAITRVGDTSATSVVARE